MIEISAKKTLENSYQLRLVRTTKREQIMSNVVYILKRYNEDKNKTKIGIY